MRLYSIGIYIRNDSCVTYPQKKPTVLSCMLTNLRAKCLNMKVWTIRQLLRVLKLASNIVYMIIHH